MDEDKVVFVDESHPSTKFQLKSRDNPDEKSMKSLKNQTYGT